MAVSIALMDHILHTVCVILGLGNCSEFLKSSTRVSFMEILPLFLISYICWSYTRCMLELGFSIQNILLNVHIFQHSPPFRSRRCRCRVLAPPAAALPAKSRPRARAKLLADVAAADPWLASLSLLPADDDDAAPAPNGWALGIDPDTRGAIAVLSPDGSSQVFDNPFVHIMVSEFTRKRLDTKSIIQLLRGLDAPPGTTAYIEKSSPFPTDGKLGWWSTGFSYGLWIASLVASGFSVVPVASQTWKAYFGLTRSESPKDDSRQAATILFPDMALSLKLKKHHGRAEALLLAAYGKGLVLPPDKFIKTRKVLEHEPSLTLTGRPD